MLDTSTVILLGELDDPSVLPDECVISAVTLAELSVGPHVADTAGERAASQAHLQQAKQTSTRLPSTRRRPGRSPASQHRCVRPAGRPAGRKPAARAYDALIAASASAQDLPLYTCNPGDFAGVDELSVRTVPNPRHADR